VPHPLVLAAILFGGFAPGGQKYLVGKDQVCRPLAVGADARAAGAPACERMEARALEAVGFQKPPRTRKLLVQVVEGSRIELSRGDQVLARWDAGKPVRSVNQGVFVSPGGGQVAIEYQTEKPEVVVFDLDAATRAKTGDAPVPPPRPTTPPQPPQPRVGPNAYDRALGKGGVWEQRLLPCEQAGVRLKLTRNRKFDLLITTKCQSEKDVTELDGTFATEGDDQLELVFDNENGPTEAMTCRIAACADVAEDCLTCGQEDVSFTLQVVHR
jgi:hypothetical protein